ncbi:MAG: F0F1 ATP synthase subunit A [Verrucomicrobiales bacterium]
MFRRPIFPTILATLAGIGTACAAGDGGHHALPLYAPKLSEFLPITNSTVMVWIAVGLIVLFCKAATKEMKLIPSGIQNTAEWMVESLYDFLEGLLGKHLTSRTFWFFGSLFFFILVVNYLGLLPGVGTIGWNTIDESGHMTFVPLLRGGNADLNMTSAMSFTFAILWFYWAITENGFKNFMAHIFAPKGDFKGGLLLAMIPVFLFVGLLEVISIMIRPVALKFRLFGNIYGGEQTLESLMALVPKWMAFAPALPFYFVELLVGFVQALVFTLLCAIFLKLICDHGDDGHH